MDINRRNTKKRTQKIEVIYEKSCFKEGTQTVQWLQESGIASQTEMPITKISGLTRHRFDAMRPIAQDAVVVFVSDEATANKDWHSYINSIPNQVRIIPIGGVESIDYSNPEVLPSQIEEINFIRLDEKQKINLLDSLVTDPKFYALKNHLLIKSKSWTLSYDEEGDLLTDLKQIKTYIETTTQKLQEEKDEYLREQLLEILEYLKASKEYAEKLRGQALGRWLLRGCFTVATVFLIISFSKFYRDSKYLYNANLVLSVDVNSMDKETGPLKLAEMISNPFVGETSKKLAKEKLVEFLGKIWPNTPIGVNYEYVINDIAIPHGTQYVWTADSGGRVICWDTHTGKFKYDKQISNVEIIKLSLSADDNTLVAMDSDGKVYVFSNKKWNDKDFTSIIGTSQPSLRTTDEKILIYNENTLELYNIEGTLLETKSVEYGNKILNAEFMLDGSILLAGENNGSLFTLIITNHSDTLEIVTHEGVKVSSSPKTDILNDILVVTDESGQVWKISNNKATKTNLALPKPIDLKLANSSTVVYHERNMGTGLYDIDESFDYGDVLVDIHGVDKLYVTDEFIVARIADNIQTYPINNVLARKNIQKPSSVDTIIYNKPKYEMNLKATNYVGIRSAEITENGVVVLQILPQDTQDKYLFMLDPAMVIKNSKGFWSQTDTKAAPDKYFFCYYEPFRAKDLPTVVGIRYEPAKNKNDNGEYFVLIGYGDGSFSELHMDLETKEATCVSSYTIPSRSAIKAIYQTDDGYLLEDVAGRFWHCDSGVKLTNKKGYIEIIRGKHHSAVTAEMKEFVSPELWEELELQIFPGGDGKVWK